MKRHRRSGLSGKSSSAQLWTEVERLRRQGSSAGKHVVAQEAYDEQRAELERARARESAILNELRAARAEASDEGLDGTSFAGKPALAKMRNTWTRFASAVMRLPTKRAELGLGALRFSASSELLADLDLFELDPPHGPVSARMRDTLRRQLTHPAFVAALCADGAGGDYYRTLFISSVARYFLRPSVWRTYEKASDEGIRDTLGTVYK